MKKWIVLLFIVTFGFCAADAFADDQDQTSAQAPIDFGDSHSDTLIGKAWKALARNDLDAVLAYTNKCISLYAEQAGKMQAELSGYVTGSNDDIFKEWALNDVSVAYFIQGEAYRAANMKDEAQEAYNKVISDYSYGQCWDPQGWFWKPAEAAQKKLDEMKGA